MGTPARSKASLRWFGVKTLYRTVAQGRPARLDEHYDRHATLVEERVVLFRARSFDDALAQGEREAREYAKDAQPTLNPYGQRLVMKYLEAADAFELFGEPGAGAEVFSTTELKSDLASDRTVIDERMGRERTADKPRRRKFLNREYAG